MKNLVSICLVLVFGFLSPNLVFADDNNTKEPVVEQLVRELSLATH